MANPIVLKHFPTDGLPRGFYSIVAVSNISVQTRAGARARSCLVIREQGRSGYSYYAQDGKRWVCVLWEHDGRGHPVEVILEDDHEEEKATKPPEKTAGVSGGKVPLALPGKALKPGKTPEIKQLAGKAYAVHADGRWVACEIPAPIF